MQSSSRTAPDVSAVAAAGDPFAGITDPGRHFKGWHGGSAPSALEPVRLHFCPDLRRAAFLITDHGDRTRLVVSRALYEGHSDPGHPEYGRRGILASGVKLTQSAFCSGWPRFDYLENPEFLALMKTIHSAGIEVCPHNTSERMDLPPEETRVNMQLYAEHFGLESWIDHFRLPTNLTQSGMDATSPYYILDRFKSLGGHTAWSFVDLYANPPDASLDHFRPPLLFSYLRRAVGDVVRAARARRFSPRNRASIGALLLELAGARAMSNIVSILKGPRSIGYSKYLQTLWQLPRNLVSNWVERLRGGRLAFPMTWDPDARLYWFDAVRVLFIAETYTPTALSRLVKQAGIHIGHTYLGFHGPKYDDCAFDALQDGQYRVRDEFQRFLEDLSGRCRQGEVWNPTLREFSAYYCRLSRLIIKREGSDVWELRNESALCIKGVTFRSIHPLRAEGVQFSGSVRHEGEYWYCLDVPSGGRATLRLVHSEGGKQEGGVGAA